MQNFGRFFATSDFDCEYLRNDLRYPNRNSKFFYIDSSCVPRNRSRELWSTTFPDLDVRLDRLKCTFWGYYISALRGCCALKFSHALEIDQGYPTHTPTKTGFPPNFNRENYKSGPKFSVLDETRRAWHVSRLHFRDGYRVSAHSHLHTGGPVN